jgi:hypothetical protein
LVLVIGVLGAWGRGKTITLTMLQDLAKTSPSALGLEQPPKIVSNYLSLYADAYIAVDPPEDLRYVEFVPKDRNGKDIPNAPRKILPVWNFLEFLKRPRSPVPIALFLDDVYGWLASYFFGSAFNRTAFRLLASGRKKNINIFESSVRFKDVDPRLRALHTHLFLPKHSAQFDTVALERYIVDVFEDRRITPDVYFNAKDYYNAYDTNEVIENVYEEGLGQEAVNHLGSVPVSSSPNQATVIVGSTPPAARPPAPQRSPRPTPNLTSAPTVNRSVEGYEALVIGHLWQHKAVCDLEAEGNYCKEAWGERDPDIIVYADEGLSKPLKVVSVKAYYLVPAKDRWTFTPPLAGGGLGGEGQAVRRHSGASGRTIYRKDIQPEINASRILGVPCELWVYNIRNGRGERVEIQDGFERYAAGREISEDEERGEV